MSTGKPLTFREFPYAGADPRFSGGATYSREGIRHSQTANGFGLALPLLEQWPVPGRPWLTPALVEQELAMQAEPESVDTEGL